MISQIIAGSLILLTAIQILIVLVEDRLNKEKNKNTELSQQNLDFSERSV